MAEHQNLIIQAACEEDLPAISELYAQPGLDDGRKLTLDEAKNVFARFSTYPNYKIYIAKVDGKVEGTFGLLIMDNLGHQGAPSGIIEDVAVSPSQQGKGIGKTMMTFAMEKCRKAGCYKLALSSNLKRSNAHEFYKSLGFEQHGYSFLVNPNA